MKIMIYSSASLSKDILQFNIFKQSLLIENICNNKDIKQIEYQTMHW